MNRFPVHLLPDRAFSWVLRRMEIYDQLAYSLCSKNAKETIKLLNLKADEIELLVTFEIELRISFLSNIYIFCFIDYDEIFPNNKIIAREDIEVLVEKPYEAPTKWNWNFRNFEFKKWIHHFCEILHHPKIDDLSFDYEEIHDAYIEPIEEAIQGLQIGCLSVGEQLTPEFAETALEAFPSCEKFDLERISFASHKFHIMDKLLVQNLKSVCIHEAGKIKIDQLLMSNSEIIQLNTSMLTEKDLNKLFKLWSRGCSPRLKYCNTEGRPLLGKSSFDKNVILQVIKYEQIPLDSEEWYRENVFGNCYSTTKIAGGSRIWRIDGTTAVILVEESRLKLIVE